MNSTEKGLMRSPDAQSWYEKHRKAVGATAAALLLVIGYGGRWVQDRLEYSPSTDYLAVGSATCKAGGVVEGVWVDTGVKSSSGWAKTTPRTGTAQTVTFRRQIDQPDFEVHVGCEGTLDVWAIADYSAPLVADQDVTQLCDAPRLPPSPKTELGVCATIPLSALLQETG